MLLHAGGGGGEIRACWSLPMGLKEGRLEAGSPYRSPALAVQTVMEAPARRRRGGGRKEGGEGSFSSFFPCPLHSLHACLPACLPFVEFYPWQPTKAALLFIFSPGVTHRPPRLCVWKWGGRARAEPSRPQPAPLLAPPEFGICSGTCCISSPELARSLRRFPFAWLGRLNQQFLL